MLAISAKQIVATAMSIANATPISSLTTMPVIATNTATKDMGTCQFNALSAFDFIKLLSDTKYTKAMAKSQTAGQRCEPVLQ